MKLTFALLLFLVPFFSPQTTPATPDLTGVWELNKAKTPASRSVSDRMRVKIEQHGVAITITIRSESKGEKEQEDSNLVVGQESHGEIHGAAMTSRAAWAGDTLVVRSIANFGKDLLMTDHWSISADGKTLTFLESHKFGEEPEGENVRVFDRAPASTWEPDAPVKPAEEVYKNIQVLKGVPSTRLKPLMTNLTKWLGVECSNCHVRNASNEYEYEKDDKAAKLTARKMFLMVRRIGAENFTGENPVTCWTCHRGQPKPQSLLSEPALSQR